MILTVISFGCFLDFLYKSSDATLFLLTTKSNDGPISSNSTFGVFSSVFTNETLRNQVKRS